MSITPRSTPSRVAKFTTRVTALLLAASAWGMASSATAAPVLPEDEPAVAPLPEEAEIPDVEDIGFLPEASPIPKPKKKKTVRKAPRCEVAYAVKLGAKRKVVNKRVSKKLNAQTGKKCKAKRKTKKIAKAALKKPCVAAVIVKASHNKKATKKRTKNQRKKVMRQHKVCATHKQKQRRAALPNRAMKVARAQLGDPYSYGAAGPDAFDCSGLTSFSYARAGKSIPRTTGAQRSATRHIARKDARTGDLVFFHGSSGVYHVGLYAGGNKVLHAPRTGSNVRYENIWTSSVSFGRIS